jgi:hypothetical protein
VQEAIANFNLAENIETMLFGGSKENLVNVGKI